MVQYRFPSFPYPEYSGYGALKYFALQYIYNSGIPRTHGLSTKNLVLDSE